MDLPVAVVIETPGRCPIVQRHRMVRLVRNYKWLGIQHSCIKRVPRLLAEDIHLLLHYCTSKPTSVYPIVGCTPSTKQLCLALGHTKMAQEIEMAFLWCRHQVS